MQGQLCLAPEGVGDLIHKFSNSSLSQTNSIHLKKNKIDQK